MQHTDADKVTVLENTLIRMVGRVLIYGAYLLALAFGLLCVVYHLFFIGYSSLDGSPLSTLGVMLAVANLLYPMCIIGLLTQAHLSKRWNLLIFKPQVWLIVLLMIPIILYLNYFLVEALAPYDYSL